MARVDLGIKGRVAMVAAASKGLGRAVAESLAREGCRLSICSRSTDNLDDARHTIEDGGGEVLAVSCDVSDASDLERWVDATTATFGQVDILVTNTGGPPAARFMQLSEEQWRSGIDSTLMNVVRLCRLVIPDMQTRKWGRIVHITSLVAKQPAELLTISSTLRAGLSALTKTLSDQVARDNILVNAILPGNIQTDRQVHLNEIRSKEMGITVAEYAARVAESIPMGRLGRPEEIGDAVTFLCSDRASYITGVSLQVDGGIIRSAF
ncbi:MAG TPA: SDR family oxidoreductase [Thermoanaerobaculia bacterium]|nr:SDR family oxidoreductase [Thermoanaerobaculia bacterium]